MKTGIEEMEKVISEAKIFLDIVKKIIAEFQPFKR